MSEGSILDRNKDCPRSRLCKYSAYARLMGQPVLWWVKQTELETKHILVLRLRANGALYL